MAAYAGIDNFDSYSDGFLNGGNGGSGWSDAWTNGTNGAQNTVQGLTTFDGSAKAVLITTLSNQETFITRNLTSSVDSGNLYIAARMAIGTDSLSGLFLRSSGGTIGAQARIGLNKLNINSTVSTDLLSGISTDTWYIFHLEFLSSTTFRARYKVSGGSWNSFTSTLTYASSVSSPSQISFYSSGEASSTNPFYWDVLGDTDPEPAEGPANLKSLDTNVKANIKSYNTNVLANIKSINGNS